MQLNNYNPNYCVAQMHFKVYCYVLQDLFFQYRWNNFLHSQVEQCIALALRGLSCDDGPGIEGEGHHSAASSPGTPPPEMTPQAPEAVTDTPVIPSEPHNTTEESAMEESKEIQLEPADSESDMKEPSPLVSNVS